MSLRHLTKNIPKNTPNFCLPRHVAAPPHPHPGLEGRRVCHLLPPSVRVALLRRQEVPIGESPTRGSVQSKSEFLVTRGSWASPDPAFHSDKALESRDCLEEMDQTYSLARSLFFLNPVRRKTPWSKSTKEKSLGPHIVSDAREHLPRQVALLLRNVSGRERIF